MDILSFALGKKIGKNSVKLQEKTVTPSESEIVVTPDAAFDALSQVTVEAVQGGGSMASGLYWELAEAPNARYEQAMFEYKGELYCVARTTSGNGDIVIFYKYNEETSRWDTHISSFSWAFTSPTGVRFIEYNGKMHMFGIGKHVVFDGGTSLTSLNVLPAIELSGNYVAYWNGRIYAFDYSGYNLYVWDESSDTWEVEATLDQKYNYLFSANNELYLIQGSKNIYKYVSGSAESTGITTTNFTNVPFVANGYLYYIRNWAMENTMYRVDLTTGEEICFGKVFNYSYVVPYTHKGEQRILFLTNNAPQNVIMHDMTE